MGNPDRIAHLELRGERYEVPSGMTIRAALERHGISPESVIATRHGEILTDDERLDPGDEIRLVAVISGGAPPETDPS
jgi:sulfur carrier protein ThiS